MSEKQASRRIEVTLVAGGKYHDIDFARRELLGLLAEHDEFRVRVQPDYEDVDGITSAEIDRDTGKLALPTCPRTLTESFLAGTEPREYCELHRW